MADSYILIKDARIPYKNSRFHKKQSLLIKRPHGEAGIIEQIGEIVPTERMKIYDAGGAYAFPAFCDMFCFLSEPGLDVSKAVLSSTVSAAAGGYSALFVCDKEPRRFSNADSLCKLMFASSFDESLPDTVFVSDINSPIDDPLLLSTVMRRCAEQGKTFFTKCSDERLARNGSVSSGEISNMLGAIGIPESAEEIAVARDLILAKETGCRLHITQVSTKGAVDLIREAKARGVQVTCDTSPLYFSMNESDVLYYGTYAKVMPPLRSEESRKAVLLGLSDGTIDCISTAHKPVADVNKKKQIGVAEQGAVGFQIAFPAAITYLVNENILGMGMLSELMSEAPARILGIGGHSLKVGEQADIVLAEPSKEIIVTKSFLKSRSHNTPFLGLALNGITLETFIAGVPQYG